MIDTFARFCETPGQRFVCSADSDRDGEEFVARITHRLNPGASSAALQALRHALGGAAEEFVAFFARFNGASLFADERSDTAGISIAPIELWDSLTEQYLEQREDFDLDAADEGDDDDEEPLEDDDEFDPDADLPTPAWMDSAVAIGEATHSGNLFLVATEGEERGNIYYFDADLIEPELFATCFAEFLARIVHCDPPRLLLYLGGFARYSDGRTHTQWVPRRYLAGET